MTAVVVQTAYNAGNGYEGSPGTPYTLTVTLGAAVTNGNAIQIAIAYSSVGTPSISGISDDKGNTYSLTSPQYWSLIPGYQIFATVANVTNGPSVFSISVISTLAATIYVNGAQVYEVSGLGNAPVIDLTFANSNSYGPGPWTNSFTTSYANEFALAITQDSGGPTLTTNWTDDSVNTGSLTFSHNNLISSGSNSYQASFTGSTQVSAYVLTTQAGSSGPELVVLQQGAASGNPPSITLTSVSSGDVIIVTSQNDANPASSETWSDNVNSGNYTLLADYTAGAEPGIFWKVANSTGAPTITCSGNSGTVQASAFVVTGWTGTPTKDTAVTAAHTATSAVLTVTPLVTNQNNEILLAISSYFGGAYGTGSSTAWTINSGAPNSPNWDSGYGAYAIGVNSGASFPISATISSSQTWKITLGGIYDNTAGTTTLVAASGQFALSGQLASFSQSQPTYDTLLANPGAFNFNGAQSQSNLQVSLSNGTFALTGQAATLTKGSGLKTLVAAYGSFTLSGQNAIFQDNRYVFSAFTGYFTLSGQPVTFATSLTGNLYPNVVGMDYYVAVEILVANGLQVNTPILKAVAASVALPGRVLFQSVGAGLPLVPNTPVTLTVASESLLSVTDNTPLSPYGPI